jgi:hypothetical protein
LCEKLAKDNKRCWTWCYGVGIDVKRDNMVYNSVKIMCKLDAFILMSQQKTLECVTGIPSQKKQLNKQRGEVVVHSLKISLEELYNGTSKKLSLCIAL